MSIVTKLHELKPGRQINISEAEILELVGRRYRKEREGDGTVNSTGEFDLDTARIALYQDVNNNWLAFRYNQANGRYRVAQKNRIYYDVVIVTDTSNKSGYSVSIAKYKHI